MAANPSDFLMVREEVFWTLLALIFLLGALLLVSVLVMWNRVGRIRADIVATLLQFQTLLMKSQGVNLAETLESVRAEMKHMDDRLSELEQERLKGRRELMDTNERVLTAMQKLRDDFRLQRDDIVATVSAEVQAGNEAHIRRVTRDEFYKLKKDG